MRDDKTLRLNFIFFVGISLISIVLVIHRIVVNDHPYFLIDTHERIFYGIDHVILNKNYYDMLMFTFFSSIIMDSAFTFLAFKQFADMKSIKKYRERLYARKIIFALAITCISTSTWAFFFFDIYHSFMSILFAAIAILFAVWKAWLSFHARMGLLNILSIPTLSCTIMNLVLSIEAISIYDD